MSVAPSDFYHFRSPLGEAVCDTCGSWWPCHLSAWGHPDRASDCSVRGCDGIVTWAMPDDAA